MGKPKDIAGQRFGKLVVIRLTNKRKNNSAVWECKCDCGNIVEVASDKLCKGSTKSCGCLKKVYSNIIEGQRFERLVTIRLMDKCDNGYAVWECKCDCGNTVEVRSEQLANGYTKSCGCKKKEICAQFGQSRSKDLTGQRFGKLIAIRPIEKRIKSIVIWECKCDCGNVAEVLSVNLIRGSTKSCGCSRHDVLVERSKNVDLKKQFGLIDNTSVSIIKSEKLPVNSKTGHKGVSYNKRKCKYEAYISFKKKRYHLGYFNTLEEAVEVRERAKEEIHGSFIKWYEENIKK
ncbi:MAG: AP2 domain-containing protein [Oscillospiraceae bacterium]|nr:AP2 domain-containing protein [Oscillospiraceae bacterium]